MGTAVGLIRGCYGFHKIPSILFFSDNFLMLFHFKRLDQAFSSNFPQVLVYLFPVKYQPKESCPWNLN